VDGTQARPRELESAPQAAPSPARQEFYSSTDPLSSAIEQRIKRFQSQRIFVWIFMGVFAGLWIAGALNAFEVLLFCGAAVILGRLLKPGTPDCNVAYELDDAERARHSDLTNALEKLSEAGGKLDIEVGVRPSRGIGKAIVEWSAGIARKAGRLSRIGFNTKPSSWRVGNESLAFLPDHIMVQAPGRLSSIRYEDLTLSFRIGEEQWRAYHTPAGAKVLAKTWEYTRKDGQPDLRYKDNPEIDTVQCAYLTLEQNGEFSLIARATDCDVAEAAYKALESYRAHLRAAGTNGISIAYAMMRPAGLVAKSAAAVVALLALVLAVGVRNALDQLIPPNATSLVATSTRGLQPAAQVPKTTSSKPSKVHGRASAVPLCGSGDALPEARLLPRWTEYSCTLLAEDDSGQEVCLPRRSYTSIRSAGCPGEQLCCPPQVSQSAGASMLKRAVTSDQPPSDVHNRVLEPPVALTASTRPCGSTSKLIAPFCISQTVSEAATACRRAHGIWSDGNGAPTCQLAGNRIFRFAAARDDRLVEVSLDLPRDPGTSTHEDVSRAVSEISGVQPTTVGNGLAWHLDSVLVRLDKSTVGVERLVIERAGAPK
jgi:hypothetical protein